MALAISSTAFASGQPIPPKYTCTGENVSPPLAWTGAPSATRSFALILEDPDAPSGTFVHWVTFNIPATSSGLPEAVSPKGSQPAAGVQGRNGGGQTGYTGPCPPSGVHRYFFKLYALDTSLDLTSGGSADQLRKAMQGHILAQGELMGTFSK